MTAATPLAAYAFAAAPLLSAYITPCQLSHAADAMLPLYFSPLPCCCCFTPDAAFAMLPPCCIMPRRYFAAL